MKALILILTILSGHSALAQVAPKDWQISREESTYSLKLKSDNGVSSSLTVMSGEPKILSVKKYGSDIVAIIYDAGVAGTSVLVQNTYALLYNTSSKKFLGDYPVEYKVSSGAPYTFDQPVWKVEGNSLRIIDENSNIDAKIKL